MSDVPTVFNGEMQLMNWGESSANGAWVKFWISPEDLEAFRHLKCKSGKIAGHRVAAVLVEIGDDEQPVQRDNTATRNNTAKGGPLAQWAAMRCAEYSFQEFLWDMEGADGVPTEDEAIEIIYAVCNITSRAELDNNAEAKRLFDERIRKPYAEWQRKRGAA